MKRMFFEMKRKLAQYGTQKFGENPLDSGYVVLVFASIGYLFSFLTCFLNARKKNKVDGAETVPTESTEEEANESETENPTNEG